MRLMDEVAYHSIQAGGPGSGRKPGTGNLDDKLTSMGFKRTASFLTTDPKDGRVQTTFTHPSGHKVTVGGGYYNHFKKDFKSGLYRHTGGGTLHTDHVMNHLKDEGFKMESPK